MIFENPTPEICYRKLIKSRNFGVSNLDLDGFPSILSIFSRSSGSGCLSSVISQRIYIVKQNAHDLFSGNL